MSNKPSQNMIRLELEDVEKSAEPSEQEQDFQGGNNQKQENGQQKLGTAVNQPTQEAGFPNMNIMPSNFGFPINPGYG